MDALGWGDFEVGSRAKESWWCGEWGVRQASKAVVGEGCAGPRAVPAEKKKGRRRAARGAVHKSLPTRSDARVGAGRKVHPGRAAVEAQRDGLQRRGRCEGLFQACCWARRRAVRGAGRRRSSPRSAPTVALPVRRHWQWVGPSTAGRSSYRTERGLPSLSIDTSDGLIDLTSSGENPMLADPSAL